MRISVALCTYNGANYIERQIRTILDQTIGVDQIVVCDDCSTDNTVDVIRRIGSEIIEIHVNSLNLGYKKNFYQAASLCRGEFIFFSDQDDEWMPDKVEEVLRCFQETGSLGVFSDGALVDENSESLHSSLFLSSAFDKYIERGITDKELFSLLTQGNNMVTGATLAIKREGLVDFSNSFLCHDYHLAIRHASVNRLSFVNKKLINYRVHSTQCLGVPLAPQDYYITNVKLYYREDIDSSMYKYYVSRKRFCYKIRFGRVIEKRTEGESLCRNQIKSLDTYFLKYFMTNPRRLDVYLFQGIQNKINRYLWLPLFMMRNKL